MGGTVRIDFLKNATGTSLNFTWQGGKVFFYAESASWNSGNVVLNFISPHGTAILVTSSTISANAGILLEVPPGSYQVVATTATVYCSMMSVPTITTR